MSQLLALLTIVIVAAIMSLFRPHRPKSAEAPRPASRGRTIA